MDLFAEFHIDVIDVSLFLINFVDKASHHGVLSTISHFVLPHSRDRSFDKPLSIDSGRTVGINYFNNRTGHISEDIFIRTPRLRARVRR